MGFDRNQEHATVDVSVAMMTYYHEQYVEKAIESVLAQKTDYTYEIVISDDCSKDRTREILLEYAEKYPDIIKLNFNEKHLGISGNNYQTRCLCKGRYIATLSGDDYWIDENKMQEQVQFLDSHPDYYAVATCIEGRFDDDDSSFAVYPKKKYRNMTIDLEMFLHGVTFGTNGMMMRNAYLTEEGREYFSLVPKASPFVDDTTECVLILKKGKVFISDKKSVVYRVQRNKEGKHNFNATNTTIQKCRKSVDLYNNLYRMIDPQPNLFDRYKDNIAVGFAQAVIGREMKEFWAMYRTLPEEYRKRGILIRSIPTLFTVCFEKVRNVILANR